MPGSTMNWERVETWERIIASIIATGVKIDLNAAAGYYGTTYHTLENRLRPIKKIAEGMKAGVGEGNGKVTPKPKPSTPRKPKTSSKDSPLDKVKNGRVSKETPSKRTKKTNIKTESQGSDVGEAEQAFDSGMTFDIPTPEEDSLLASAGMQDNMADGFGFDFSF